MPLQRLLTVATLTPAQAALLARDLVGGLDAIHRIGSDGVGIDAASVRLTGTGQVRFDPLWDGADTPGTAGSAAAVLDELIASARRAGPGRQSAVARLMRLEEVNGDVTALAGRVGEVADELLDGGSPRRVEHVRRGLGALAVASRSLDPGTSAEEPRARETAASVATPLTRRPRLPRDGRVPRRMLFHRRRRGGRLKVFVLLLLAAALVAGGWWAGPRIWDEVRDTWDELFGSSDPPPVQIEPVSPPPEPDDDADEADGDADPASGPVTAEAPAPESAGAVSGVRMETTAGTCTAGSPCPVRVEVDLDPAGSARQVTWGFEIVDRCAAESTTQGGVTVTAQSGWTQVWGLSQVDLPDGAALAVFAVTDSPDQAASGPMLVPEDADTC